MDRDHTTDSDQTATSTAITDDIAVNDIMDNNTMENRLAIEDSNITTEMNA